MNAYSDELRLLWTLLLNGGLFAAAYYFARRRGNGGIIQAICDAFLFYFLAQYAAVALPGVLGVLNAWTMTLVAVGCAAALVGSAVADAGSARLVDERQTENKRVPASAKADPTPSRASHRTSPRTHPDGPAHPSHDASLRTEPPASLLDYASLRNEPLALDRLILIAAALFVAGYLGCYAWSQRYLPPIATDALVYHLPTAVQWMQTHRLGIYPTWYWNPAASYSPQTGSIFMVWWMAPAGNDLFVRFVQLPPLIFIFFLVVRFCRLMGCSRGVAGLIGVAATLCRPLFSEAIFPKDDLYVTAFVAAAVLSLAREPIRDRCGPWRAGISLGLVFASKYTVLLACPIFLFLIDSPFRARWKVRQWAIAIIVVLILVLPWYLRNILLTGNPLYPVDVHLPFLTLRGLFTTERDRQLRTAGGAWHMLEGTYHGLPIPLIVILLLGWIASIFAGWRRIWIEPLPRACAIGSVATAAIFFITSPHHEVRYVFPLIVLLFAAAGLALASFERADAPTRSNDIGLIIASCVAIASVGTSFSFELIAFVATFAGEAALVTIIGVGLFLLQTRVLHFNRDRLALSAACAAIILGIAIYTQWHAYVESYRQARQTAWGMPTAYPRQAEIWKWVDDNVRPDATLAYANTFFVYPYYGFDLTRHVGYAPIRRGLHDFLHFPRMGERVPGDLLVRRMTEVMNADPDRDTWLANLQSMQAEYLVVMKHDPDNPDLSADPPELHMAREMPTVFVPVEETEAGAVFRVELK